MVRLLGLVAEDYRLDYSMEQVGGWLVGATTMGGWVRVSSLTPHSLIATSMGGRNACVCVCAF